ncbi:XRE family transcriptional regulator [Streptomyces sp. SID8379]|uniref:DUF5753 domain-containing protein n=1 Tax=unclassified Streptomyces TaxID=2593676 RepID=UPI0003A3A73D|nr:MULTISPECIES: DUF5753 domain-containing protein [unclassified Streptomyces]MYW67159.1 XRE family transcriptional regulator [Streptomyces sp. SID8379]
MPKPTKAWSELHREGMGPTQEAFLDLVRSTTDSQHYCQNIVWGNLQTPDYVRAMLKLVVDFHGFPDDIEAGVAARTARAELIGQDGRTYHVLLGESALRRNVGGVQTMRGQLARILHSFGLPGLTLGVIPERAQLGIYPGNSFSLFDGARVEIENYGDTPTITDDEQVAIYSRAFAVLKRDALYGEEARALVQAELDEL